MKKTFILIFTLVVLLIMALLTFYFWPHQLFNSPQAQKKVTNENLKNELEKIGIINIYPNNKNINPAEYPIVLGQYYKNNLTLIETYHCSDVCPDYGGVSIIFQNIKSKEECAKADGQNLIDPAWGGYIGCTPKID